jgi:hypothetical protein
MRAGIRGADVRLGGAAGGVFGGIEWMPKPSRPAQTRRGGGIVFADAGGEDQGVDAAEFDHEGADPVADRVDEGVERERASDCRIRRLA